MKRWDATATATLRRWAGERSAAEIAEMIGCTRETVQRHMSAADLAPYHPRRRNMTRRERLLCAAAGLGAAELEGD